mmetsp:Transcript_29399/g.44866  ORF Transcript_29399/g.44866 Transcript_29399/m.44866 type:complete len:485 (-) Transcript_29399:222-1676(-)
MDNEAYGFPAEDLLTTPLPNYNSERISLTTLLILSTAFWFYYFPVSSRSKKAPKLSDENDQKEKSRAAKKNSENKSRIIITRFSRFQSTTKHVYRPGKARVRIEERNGHGKEDNEMNGSISLRKQTICVIMFMFTSLLILSKSSSNAFTSRGVFEAPLFTADECQSIVDRSYAAAKRNTEDTNSDELLSQEPAGWQKSRHNQYPTVDLNLVTDPFLQEDRSYIEDLMDRRLTPLLQRIYGVVPASIRANDIFVVRYTADTREKLAKHTDDSDISFNILLSNEFEGGGTRFWDRRKREPFVTIQPNRVGHVLTHASQLAHEGLPVTSGVRHILVGFLSIDRYSPLSPHESSRLSWFASWLSLNFLLVKFKDGFEAAYVRLADSESSHLKSRWTDHKYIRFLFRDIIVTVRMLGDMLCPHKHYSLVASKNEDRYLQRFSTMGKSSYRNRKGPSWFGGQQLHLDFDGKLNGEWKHRRENIESSQQDL